MKRLTLAALALASGSMVACSSGGGPAPTPTNDAGPDTVVTPDGDMPDTVVTPDVAGDRPADSAGDRPADVAGDRADAGATCGRLPYTVVARMGNTTTVRGDTTQAWMDQTMGRPAGASPIRPPSGSTTCVAMSGQLVYQYTTGSMPAALNVSTTNMGTPGNFDTVLWITNRCANTLTAAACNDDDPRYAAAADRRVSSYVTTEVVPANTTLYIIVGGFYPPGSGMVTIDHGAFEMTITELPGVSEGGACDPSGLTNRCAMAAGGTAALVCVADSIGATMGRCRQPGSVAGSACRASEPRCDMGLTCSAATGGICQRPAMADMACDAFSACPEGFYCANTTIFASAGTCRRIGSQLGSACRPMGATGGRCDSTAAMPLVCSSDVDPTDTTPTCVRPATMGGECDLFRSVCPMGSSCVTANGSAVLGRCTAFGAGPRARCRATAPRCDMGLECITLGEGDAAEDLCLTRSTTNGACGPARQCPEGNTCYLTDLTDRQNGLCGAEGMAGGACREGATNRCDAPLTCSATGTGGLCGTASTMMGAPCDRLRTRCGEGFSCVLSAGSQSMGTCQPDGSVVGAECRSGDMPCATGLTCSGSALSGGVCQRAATAGMACDPINGTTRCPMNQYCLATAFNAGTCAGGATAEMEPNDNPSNVTARAVTAPSLFTGALGRFDIDCYAVTVPAGGRVVALISDGNGRCPVNIGGRIAMDMYSSDGTTVRGIVTQNGPFSAGSCSHIDGGRTALYPWASGLAAGTYYVCVRGVNDATVTTQAVESYVLSIAPRPGA